MQCGPARHKLLIATLRQVFKQLAEEELLDGLAWHAAPGNPAITAQLYINPLNVTVGILP